MMIHPSTDLWKLERIHRKCIAHEQIAHESGSYQMRTLCLYVIKEP